MDNRIYGYARVSSREQNEDRQIEALTKFGVPLQNIITDKCSGKDTEREGYQYLKHQILRSGDTLVILRAIANRNNDLQSAVFDGGRRIAPLSAPLYALFQSHIVALAAAAQPANHNIVVICNRGQYIKELDRLSRNKSDIKNELEYFKSIGVRVKILDIPTTLTDFPDEQLWVMDMINAKNPHNTGIYKCQYPIYAKTLYLLF